MIKFDPENRVRKITENIHCVSIGTQKNCAGIACILASIEQRFDNAENDLGVDPMGYMSEREEYYGNDIPEPLKDAVLAGVLEELAVLNIEENVTFRLVGLLYHPVDSNNNMHKIAGREIVKNWFASRA